MFVGALVVRTFLWEHDCYRTLSDYTVMVERIIMAVVLVLFAGAITGGLLAPLTLGRRRRGLVPVFVVLLLTVLQGITAFPMMNWLEWWVESTRDREPDRSEPIHASTMPRDHPLGIFPTMSRDPSSWSVARWHHEVHRR